MFNFIPARLAAGVALLGGVAFGATAQAAAYISTTAEIWGLTDSSGLLSFSNDSFLNDASTLINSGFSAGSSVQDYYFNDGTGGNVSYAETATNQFGPPGLPSTHAGAAGTGQGSATAAWYFDYTATGTGTVSLSFQYNTNVTVLGYQAGETAVGSASVNVLQDGTTNQADYFSYFQNQDGDNASVGNLVLTFAVTAGQTGSISVTTASNALTVPAPAAVPVPAAAWLFGAALTTLFGLGRRKA